MSSFFRVKALCLHIVVNSFNSTIICSPGFHLSYDARLLIVAGFEIICLAIACE